MKDWVVANLLGLIAALIAVAVLVAAGTHYWIALPVIAIVVLPALLRPVRRNEVRERQMVAPPPEDDPLVEVKAAFRGFDSPAFLLDMRAEVLYQNPSAEHLFGRMEVGQHISLRIRMPVVIDMIREAVARGENGEVEYTAQLPTELAYKVRLIKTEGLETKRDFYVLIFRDVSEARRIDRMRTDFVANASHELRTPLASLRGFIETLQGPARNDAAAQQKFLGIMLEQVTRMSRLVDDLLSLSRLELKAHLPPNSEVDLVPLIGSVSDALQPLASSLGVEIRVDTAAESVMVQGDADELTQVFENLLENACKYGQDGKFVDVRIVSESRKPVEVRVTDHGPGIPQEHVPRLTERFYRVNVESSRSKKGTGLGLAIVKHILTRHKARLLIRSEIGKGSTFTVRF